MSALEHFPSLDHPVEQPNPDAESYGGPVPDHSIAAIELQLQAIVRGYHEMLQEGSYESVFMAEPGIVLPPPPDVAANERWLRSKVQRLGESQDFRVSSPDIFSSVSRPDLGVTVTVPCEIFILLDPAASELRVAGLERGVWRAAGVQSPRRVYDGHRRCRNRLPYGFRACVLLPPTPTFHFAFAAYHAFAFITCHLLRSQRSGTKTCYTGWSCPDMSCCQTFGTELDFSQHHLFHDVDGTRQEAFARFITDATQTLLGLNRFWELFKSTSGHGSYDAATLLEIMQAVSLTFRSLEAAE
jgi:hypothetical protein